MDGALLCQVHVVEVDELELGLLVRSAATQRERMTIITRMRVESNDLFTLLSQDEQSQAELYCASLLAHSTELLEPYWKGQYENKISLPAQHVMLRVDAAPQILR